MISIMSAVDQNLWAQLHPSLMKWRCPCLAIRRGGGGGIATAVDGRAAFVFIIITITMCANLKMTISRSMSTYPSDSKNLCLIDDDDDDLDYSWIEDFVVKRSSLTDEKSSLSPWPTLIWLSLLSYGNHDLTVAKHYDFLLFCRILYFQVNLFIRLKKFMVDWQQEYRVCHILLSTFLVFIWRILY